MFHKLCSLISRNRLLISHIRHRLSLGDGSFSNTLPMIPLWHLGWSFSNPSMQRP
ncbi:hypothetical protein Hanom_Chr00s000006g01614111 [Helianthus anomalus]